MKVLFLDIDGVLNCSKTTQRHQGFIGIDPYMAFLVAKIVLDTGCEVVLSSSWRHHQEGREEVRKRVCPFIDITPNVERLASLRGDEIAAWLSAHPEVTRYAILDDNSDMLAEQMPNFFKTEWEVGITPEIAARITAHLTV